VLREEALALDFEKARLRSIGWNWPLLEITGVVGEVRAGFG